MGQGFQATLASGGRDDTAIVLRGGSVSEAQSVLTRSDVMDGVAEMIPEIQVEATFPDGTKLVTVHHPIV